MIGILLPTRGRHQSLLDGLNMLSNSYESGSMEVVVVADDDRKGYEIARDFKNRKNFAEYTVFLTKARVFSVSAFNIALKLCRSNIFFWTSNKIIYEKDWLIKNVDYFNSKFPDEIGVLASGGKLNKANFGMSSKKFIGYNEGEWFWDGYKMNFCDDELSCRAVLIGRYAFFRDSGIFIDYDSSEKELLYPNQEEKIQLKRADRGIFYKRSEDNFFLPENKVYKWEGFRELSLPLRSEP